MSAAYLPVLFLLSMKEFEPVFFRGDPEMLTELTSEKSGTAETAPLGDLLD